MLARVVCNRNQVSVWRTETKMSSCCCFYESPFLTLPRAALPISSPASSWHDNFKRLHKFWPIFSLYMLYRYARLCSLQPNPGFGMENRNKIVKSCCFYESPFLALPPASPAHIKFCLILTYLAVVPNMVVFLAGFFHPCLFLDTLRGCSCLDSETVSNINRKKWFRLFAMLESVYEKVTSLTPLWAKSPPNFLHTFARLKSWQATSYPISRQFLNDLWGLHTVHLFQFSWNVKKIMCYTCVCKCGFKKTNYNKRGRRHCNLKGEIMVHRKVYTLLTLLWHFLAKFGC